MNQPWASEEGSRLTSNGYDRNGNVPGWRESAFGIPDRITAQLDRFTEIIAVFVGRDQSLTGRQQFSNGWVRSIIVKAFVDFIEPKRVLHHFDRAGIV